MSLLDLQQPLCFAPIFQERIWGGRRLKTLFGKALPPGQSIGESWEIVDRPEAQSIVLSGPLTGRSLHDLWRDQRVSIFGPMDKAPRFPLLIKLLDAEERLSLQVHPPPEAAAEMHGEPKTEFWYVAHAAPGSELIVGFNQETSRAEFAESLERGTAEERVYRLPVRVGNAMFLPSGRIHAIGAGSVIVEIQQNSDTTYRCFDWNRRDENGEPRRLHIAESLRSINFNDVRPSLVAPAGESLVRDDLFVIEKWTLSRPRTIAPPGTFAIVIGLTGACACAGVTIAPGQVMLVPACLAQREIEPRAAGSTLLRVTTR